ncbi:MAG: DNA alkylation repair protein [Candidatus Bathyarchaeia archaeon]
MKIEGLHSEVAQQLERKADAEVAKMAEYYHKTSGHLAYGVRTSELREMIKEYCSIFKQLSLKEKLELAKMFFRSGIDEQCSFGNAILEHGVKEMRPADFRLLDKIAEYLNNWATTDGLCIGTLQPLLLAYPKEILSLLRRWNKSENLWKRRASVVAFTRKIGSSGKFTDEALGLCNNLLWDEKDMVRKGVGWALKDVMRGDKRRVLDYVKSLRRKGVSSVITLYAIRALKGKERDEILAIEQGRGH